MNRFINIALLGHVAHGKTTTVNALCNVDTKRYASEAKSGKTMKLGYANCILWKCENCTHIGSTSQGVKAFTCPFCFSCMKPEKYISFVDLPGHHSYVSTAIKGSSVVDAGILVVDVKRESLQPQALEHLAILSVLGIRDVLIVHNKIDLVDREMCEKSYHTLRKELEKTDYGSAPIIPISAQKKIKIENLTRYLYKLCENVEKRIPISPDLSLGIFSIIRSFDINKPNSDVEELKGGVIGGTVKGTGKLSVNDSIVILPGIKQGQVYTPLRTKITSIYSENTSLMETSGAGGLYGIGTCLDPTLTKSDALVGCLAGIEGTLPDVINELELSVTYIRLTEDAEKIRIKNGQVYRLLIGNANILGIADKTKDKKIWKLRLLQPICTFSCKCLIYTQESSNTQLIAFGTWIKDGSVPISENKEYSSLSQIPTELAKKTTFSGLFQTFEEYEQLLPVQSEDTKQREKQKLPIPKLVRQNRDVIWQNFSPFCTAVFRTELSVLTYVRDETCTELSICDLGLRMVKAKVTEQKLVLLLKRYITENVTCKQCGSLNTTAKACNSCGATVRDLTGA